ncbi:hypothetical protein [Bradyrhizobium sp. USDA 372]
MSPRAIQVLHAAMVVSLGFRQVELKLMADLPRELCRDQRMRLHELGRELGVRQGAVARMATAKLMCCRSL